MRIISGNYRGKKLQSIEGLSTRPTTDRVKESLFNLIQFDVVGSKVLDLFSGSGSLGIECVSRGAKAIDFNDINRDCITVIKKNLEGMKGQYNVYDIDYLSLLGVKKNEKYDLIFVDAPYKMDIASELLTHFVELESLVIGGKVIFETDKQIEIHNDNFEIIKTKKYGITFITIMERVK